MSGEAGADLIGALALMVVFEGLALAFAAGRIEELLAQLRDLAPDRLRWAGLAMAMLGTSVYVLIRG